MQWEKDFLISITILIIATIIAHIFFYQTAHNINVPMIYTLATFFISRYTKGYGWGIVSSLLSVIFINWRFTFPYFKINFMIDGYPMTFLGILVIAIITNMTTTSLNREKEAAVKREKELAGGKGFADLVFIPKKQFAEKPALVVELKWDKSAESAIKHREHRKPFGSHHTGIYRKNSQRVWRDRLPHPLPARPRRHDTIRKNRIFPATGRRTRTRRQANTTRPAHTSAEKQIVSSIN